MRGPFYIAMWVVAWRMSMGGGGDGDNDDERGEEEKGGWDRRVE